MLRGSSPHVGAADLKQLLLEGMLLHHTSEALLAWGEVWLRTLLGSGHRLLIDGLDGGGPVAHRADTGRADTPDVAIAAIFSPPRLIGLHRRTATDLSFLSGIGPCRCDVL